jgi:hypothetical protein
MSDHPHGYANLEAAYAEDDAPPADALAQLAAGYGAETRPKPDTADADADVAACERYAAEMEVRASSTGDAGLLHAYNAASGDVPEGWAAWVAARDAGTA